MDNFSIEEISNSFINLLTLTALGAPADFNFLGEKFHVNAILRLKNVLMPPLSTNLSLVFMKHVLI